MVLAFLHFTKPLADIPALVEVHHESAAFPQGLDAQLYRIPEAQAITEMFTQALASWKIAIKETGKNGGAMLLGHAVRPSDRTRHTGDRLVKA